MSETMIKDGGNVTLLARQVKLDIPRDRVEYVAAVFNAWQLDAIALASRMSEAGRESIPPITIFLHSRQDEGELA